MTLAWIGALAIGLSLGLLGSGGSILTVPVLVYLVGQDEKTAIGGSLFVVGAIAAVGGVQYALERRVDWTSVLWFGLPGMVGTYLGAALSKHVSGLVQITVFSLVMLTAAVLMLRASKRAARKADPPTDGSSAAETGLAPDRRRQAWKQALDGLGVGLLAGFVGVGGGFLIVPALTVLGGLPMALAIGTSLVVIALQSFTGFAKYTQVLADLDLPLDWPVLLSIAAVGIVGSVVGRKVSGRLSEARLKYLFALFLIVIGAFILWHSLSELVARPRLPSPLVSLSSEVPPCKI